MKEIVYGKYDIVHSGKYRDCKFIILVVGVYPVACVENIANIKDIDKANSLIPDVHGGFTYIGKEFWADWEDKTEYLKWDYNTENDYYSTLLFTNNGKKWTTKEIYEEVKSVIDKLIDFKNYIK